MYVVQDNAYFHTNVCLSYDTSIRVVDSASTRDQILKYILYR